MTQSLKELLAAKAALDMEIAKARTSAAGAGLGLSIVATIMQLHNGRYSVSSQNGVTCFELLFPGREAD